MAVTRQPNRLNSMANGDLVDHRAGDQEAQGDSDRDAGGDEPDERGDELQEQNGVITPSPAAITLPTPSRLPPSRARVCSMLMYERSTVTMKMVATSSSAILIVCRTRRKVQGAGQRGIRVHPEPVIQHRVPQPTVHPVRRDRQGEDLTARVPAPTGAYFRASGRGMKRWSLRS